MKVVAAVSWEPGEPLSVEELNMDEPRQHEIVVRMMAVGICHTDINARNHRLPVQHPMIFGHEGAGIVERVGTSVTKVAPGDKVLLLPDYCGDCDQCKQGRTSYCENLTATVFNGVPRAEQNGKKVHAAFFGQSSFSNFSLVTERNVLKVSQDAPLEYLAALTCGIQAGAGAVLNAMNVKVGTSFAVFGTGAVGMGALMMAKIAGASTIIAVDRVAERLNLALELGATHVINTKESSDITKEISELTGGGCDFTLDTTGVPDIIRTAFESLRTLGMCGVVAGTGREITLPVTSLLQGGRMIRGIMGGNASAGLLVKQLVSLYESGRFPFDRFVRHYPFQQVNTAMDDMLAGKVIKPVLTFANESLSK